MFPYSDRVSKDSWCYCTDHIVHSDVTILRIEYNLICFSEKCGMYIQLEAPQGTFKCFPSGTRRYLSKWTIDATCHVMIFQSVEKLLHSITCTLSLFNDINLSREESIAFYSTLLSQPPLKVNAQEIGLLREQFFLFAKSCSELAFVINTID